MMENPNRLLVVDDDPGISDLITEVGGDLGYQAVTASTRDALLTALPELQPTVVSLDLSMPDLDGIEVLTLLADQGSRARVMLTSGLDARVLAKAREIGESHGLVMLDQLPKPFDIGVLEQRLKACMVVSEPPLQEADLAAAIANGELEVYYQPKVNLQDPDAMSIVGAEALVRWNHASRGVVGPDAFIPLAEQSGLIVELSRYVFRQSAAYLAGVLENRPGFTLAVNLSAESFNHADLPRELAVTARELGVPPGRMVVEVTESTAMSDVERSLETMTRLRVKGFGLALDDFGTGFSSLSYLHRMPFTELKVDRSFVMGLTQSEEAEVIVRSTIDLGHNLGLAVCAEGVEDEACLERLLRFGPDSAQGYLFSRPVPASELEALLANPPPILRQPPPRVPARLRGSPDPGR